MSFRKASGREICNHCQQFPDAGEGIYVGERVTAFWCVPCAKLVLHLEPKGPIPDVTPVEGFKAIDPALMGERLRTALEEARSKREQHTRLGSPVLPVEVEDI